ncbi:type IV toxin-antitoxin system AbiEi family antitoxin domain-containing protein [Asticcacaulis benevestitus]|uniref:type IV toxin-antitoxin system AbiEi family antitoxin domain-containing protein n=1 Tax=Asticcacaulis benevestitus TaxID=347481 RepID=UPI0009D96D11
MSERHRNHRVEALALANTIGMARARDFAAAGIPLSYLKRMTDAGELVKLGRGLYQVPERVGEDVAHDLAEAAPLSQDRTCPSRYCSLLLTCKTTALAV